jgi:putative ABC transport system permease protein
MFDLLNEIWQTMNNNRLRTALTGLAVSWGIFMLIILVGMAKGVMNAFSDGNFAKSSNVILLWGGYASNPYMGLKEGRYISLKEKNMAAIERENAAKVETATAETDIRSANISTTRDYVSKSLSGVYPEAQEALTMDYGRFINDRDLAETRKVIVLDYKSAEVLFKDPTSAVGKNVNVNDLSFTIVGVYKDDWRRNVYIPYTTAKAISGYKEEVDNLRVTTKHLDSEDEAKELENSIRATLGKQNNHSADDTGAVHAWNRLANYFSANIAMSILNITMWVIGLLTLITGVVGVSNIMFVSVRERTHEIGIRRAIGAKPHNILLQVIIESVAITTLFGYIGILFGTIGTEVISHLLSNMDRMDMIKNPHVDISLAIQVTIVLIISGALAGLFPALKALKVNPVEALRTE